MDFMGFLLIAAIVAVIAGLIALLILGNKKINRTFKQAEEQVQAQLIEPERMQLVHNGNGTAVYRDAQTGVQYLMVAKGWHGVAITPMFDRDGKPLQG